MNKMEKMLIMSFIGNSSLEYNQNSTSFPCVHVLNQMDAPDFLNFIFRPIKYILSFAFSLFKVFIKHNFTGTVLSRVRNGTYFQRNFK